MADIYLAYDNESGQTVAIKMVHGSAGEYCERFRHEVEEIAGLAHEHILPAFDYGEYESWYFLVTPYIEYGTLNDRLASGPLSMEEIDSILGQLSEALQFAHEQGVIHRDVKPSNVLMRNGNHVYLADFGLVKRVGQENGLTVTGYLIGTPEYMAPELAEEDATSLSDIYALGVLLYQMLAGRVPFKANTPMGVFLRHIRDTPEPPTTFNSSIPSEVEGVVLRALEKDPHRRYQSARALYEAYQQAVKAAASRREGISDQPTKITADQLDATHVVAATDDLEVARPASKRREPFLFTIAAMIALLIGVFALADPGFSPIGQGNNTHTVDAQDARSQGLPSPASTAANVTSGSHLDSAASARPTASSTRSVGANVTSGAPATILNRNSGSSSQQDTNTENLSANNSNDNKGGGDGADSSSNASGKAGSQDGSGTGSVNSPGNGDAAPGQGIGVNGGGGAGPGAGSTNNGGQGAGGTNNGGPGNGKGQTAGDGGDQSAGNGNGQGNGNGNGNSNGQGNGNGNGQGKGHGNGNGNGNGKGKGHGKGND